MKDKTRKITVQSWDLMKTRCVDVLSGTTTILAAAQVTWFHRLKFVWGFVFDGIECSLSIGGITRIRGEIWSKGRSLFLSLGLVLCLFSLLLLGPLDPESEELLGGASHAQGLVDAVFPLLVGDDTGLLALLDRLDWHDGSSELGGQFQLSLLIA